MRELEVTQVRIKNYRAIDKGNLQGYVDLFLPELKWTLKGCPYFKSDGKRWIKMPSRPYADNEGKTRYATYIDMPKEYNTFFQEISLQALDHWLAHGKNQDESSVFE